MAHLVSEWTRSRKFYQSHSLRDALVYRHSLPVDSTPSHGLSISPFLFALLCLHFYRSLSFSLSLPPGKFTVRSRHITLQGHLCPSHQKIKKKKKKITKKRKRKHSSHSCAKLSINNITRSYLIPQPHNLLEGTCLPATWLRVWVIRKRNKWKMFILKREGNADKRRVISPPFSVHSS